MSNPPSGPRSNGFPHRQRPFLAAYCVVISDGRLLVMRRQNTGYADGQWSIPAGHVDEGESAMAAASRELSEETGLIVAAGDWRLGCTMHRCTPDREGMELFLVATVFSGNLWNREPAKCAALAFRPLADLPRPFLGYIETAIRAIEVTLHGSPLYLEEGWA